MTQVKLLLKFDFVACMGISCMNMMERFPLCWAVGSSRWCKRFHHDPICCFSSRRRTPRLRDMQVGYLSFSFIYPSIQLLFHFHSTRAFLPFWPMPKTLSLFSCSLFSVTCRCYKQILIATLPLVGSTSYTIETSNTKLLGSSFLV